MISVTNDCLGFLRHQLLSDAARHIGHCGTRSIVSGRSLVSRCPRVDRSRRGLSSVDRRAAGKSCPEVAAAALFAPQRRAGDQPRDGHQVECAASRHRRTSRDAVRSTGVRRVETADGVAAAPRACGTDRRDRHIRSRTARGRWLRPAAGGRRRRRCDGAEPRASAADAIRLQRRRRGGCCIAIAARAPNTSPSSSELLASRLAPWTPVHATSPAANSPGTDVRAPFVGVDAAHDVVRRGADRNRIAREIEAHAGGTSRRSSETARRTYVGIEVRQRQEDAGRRSAPTSRTMLRATTSRGARSPSG